VNVEERQLQAGRVGRAHGLDGSFYVTHARPQLLVLGASVTIDGRTAEIMRRAGTDRRPIVRLADVDDRQGAEALHGQTLTVAAGDAPELAEREWWAHELEGCLVLDGSREVGTVVRVIELPSCEALAVRARTAADELLIPMVKEAIRAVDVDAARIDVNMSFIEE
jgi:16S rRNA processing protein RimM